MSDFPNILIRRGDQTWRVGDDETSLIDSPDAPNWFLLEDDPRATRVKVGLGRSVWRVVLGAQIVFVKRFESSNMPGAKVWKRLIGSRAEREWEANQKARCIDLPAARCLAWGINRKKQVHLFEGIPDSETLAEWWNRATKPDGGQYQGRDRKGAVEPCTSVEQNQIIRCVARLTAKAHRSGFVHRDGHPGNILISLKKPQPEAYFLDLLGARFLGQQVPDRPRQRSIAQLNHYFSDELATRSKLRFIVDYWNAFSSNQPDLRKTRDDGAEVVLAVPHAAQKAAIRRFLAEVNKITSQHAEALARQRDRRIGRNGSYFATIKLANGWRAVVTLKLARRRVFPDAAVPDRTVSDWVRVLARIGLTAENDPSDPTRTMPAIIMDRSSLARSLSSEGLALLTYSDGCVVAKSWVRPGSPWRGFVRNHELRHRDQPHELMLAYVEHRSWFRITDSFLIVPADLRFQKLSSSEVLRDV